MSDLNSQIANAIGSASFVLTAIALLMTAIAIAFSAWANWRAKQSELEAKRLEMSYRLLLAASGGGDARLPNKETHYSSMEVQTMAIAALRSFPENRPVYERLLAARNGVLIQSPEDVCAKVLKQETESLLSSIQRT